MSNEEAMAAQLKSLREQLDALTDMLTSMSDKVAQLEKATGDMCQEIRGEFEQFRNETTHGKRKT
jgi:predicted  nucleic acid-binding Zn-ribbon protein